MKKMLLHACCGPCLSGADKALSDKGFCITGYFYNPNIHPEEEFNKRIDSLEKFSSDKGLLSIIDFTYDIALFDKEVMGKPGDRCENCYRLRLDRTAKYAADNNFDLFSTTLLLSPYQKHDKIKAVGEELSEKYKVGFHYMDMRPYYKGSIETSKQMGLYRQKYCGCYKSIT
jgi:predicted adenine nucleotide alpha hydrolase (AANH) superfamily ATPase